MFKVIKKAAIITKDNVNLALCLVIYLIITSILLSRLAYIQNNVLFLAFIIAILVSTAAFFAGWFNMIKGALSDSLAECKTPEEKLLAIGKNRKYFFTGVQSYILPVLTVFILYYALLVLWIAFNIKIAEHFIGKIDFLFGDLKEITRSKEATLAYLTNLPGAKVNIIYGWQLLFSAALSLYAIVTVFWLSALYYAKNDSKNPFLALWKSATAVFKKPLGVIGINIFIAILLFGIGTLGKIISPNNQFFAFIYLLLIIYLAVYVYVLIFTYYEKELKDNSNDGPDGIREDNGSDNSGEEA